MIEYLIKAYEVGGPEIEPAAKLLLIWLSDNNQVTFPHNEIEKVCYFCCCSKYDLVGAWGSLCDAGYIEKLHDSILFNKQPASVQNFCRRTGAPSSCTNCEARDNLTLDHKKPRSKGGGNEDSNLQVLCQSCNSKKSDKYYG